MKLSLRVILGRMRLFSLFNYKTLYKIIQKEHRRRSHGLPQDMAMLLYKVYNSVMSSEQKQKEYVHRTMDQLYYFPWMGFRD